MEIGSDNASDKLFGVLHYESAIRDLCVELVEWLSVAVGSKVKKKKRERAEEKVKEFGGQIFSRIFGLCSASNRRLVDIFQEAISDPVGEVPTIIFEGDWYAMPWEALYIPNGVLCNELSDRFLGEIAIISAIPYRESMLEDDSFDVKPTLQIASIVGQSSLKHSASDREFVSTLYGEYISAPRFIEGMSSSPPGGTVEDQNCVQFKHTVNQNPPASFIHGAFHSETPRAKEDVELAIDRSFYVTSTALQRNFAHPESTNVAFFNTCQGLTQRLGIQVAWLVTLSATGRVKS